MRQIGGRNRDISDIPENQPYNEHDQTERPRNILRTRTFSSMNFSIDKTLGWKIRDAVGSLEKKLGPYLKKVFPNFIAVHYAYILTCAFLCSIILYPKKNIRYIDALFFAACSCTQAGLNTIDLNSLCLYQQITMYIFCTITTPIFIHGSLLFLRLYWFERHFDNIRATSKLNFKMRRTATLMARTQSMDRTRSFELQRVKSQGFQKSNAFPTGDITSVQNQSSPLLKHIHNSSSSDELKNIKNSVKSTQAAANIFHHQTYHNNEGVKHMSEPSSENEQDRLPHDKRHTNRHDSDPDSDPDPDIDEVTSYFGNQEGLFSPSTNIKFADLPKPRKQEVEPRDVFMSISMMRNNQNQKHDNDEEEGPALVINGPAEREPPLIQFDLANSSKSTTPTFHSRKKSGLKRSFIFRNKDSNDEDEETNNNIARTQSHLPLPSSDQTGGSKFTKRSNTLDVPEQQLNKSPTFDKLIKKKLRKPSIGFNQRRSSSNAIDMSGSETESDDDDNNSDDYGLRRQFSTNYLSWNPTVGRNSTFMNLSDKQKEELGGVEYRAIKLLAKIVVVYYIGFHILGFMFLVPWIIETHRYQPPVSESGVSLTWWGFFTSMSAFNDLGYTLTPNSMNSFVTSPYALLVASFFIIIGNTGFPILLRFIIWIIFKLSKDLSLLKESSGFLLDHPRRCFTLLFPSAPTWWLLFILVALNLIDLVLFIILDIGASVLNGLTTGQKILAGFFQAVSTRTAGFSCVDLSQLHPSVQVSYMVMMYISVLPLAISIRRTNVYEEQSLGVYMGHNEHEPDHDTEEPTSFISAHLRKQLSFDLWFVFLGLFIICIAEGTKIKDVSIPSFNTFQCLFEVVSAYGTVGLSLGYPDSNTSFSAQLGIVSKLVIIAMVIRGRHRGLPYALDRAIMLPSEKMEMRDKYQGIHAVGGLNRAETIGSVNDPVFEFFKRVAPKALRDRVKRPSSRTFRSSYGSRSESQIFGNSSGQQHAQFIPGVGSPSTGFINQPQKTHGDFIETPRKFNNLEINQNIQRSDVAQLSPRTAPTNGLMHGDVEMNDLDITDANPI